MSGRLARVGLRGWTIDEPGGPAIYRLALGSLINRAGSGATAVAFGFFLYERTQSAVWLSIWYFFSFGISGVLTPLAGWLADRFDRRHIVVISQLLSAVFSLSLIVIQDPTLLVTLAFFASIVSRTAYPAFEAAMPNLTGEESLEWANGRIRALANVGTLLGPVIGGALYATAGRTVVFALDALTFVLCALSVASIRAPFSASTPDDAPRDKQSPPGGVFEGFRLVFADPVLRPLAFIWAAGYFAVDITLVGELPLALSLGASALMFGILEAGWGGGVIIGSLLGGKLREDQDLYGITVGVVAIVIGLALSALSPWLAPLFILTCVIGAGSGIWDVGGFSLMQRRSDDMVRGRVMSTFGTIGLAANAIAFAVAGPMVEAIGPRSVFLLGALVCSSCIPLLISMRNHRVRTSVRKDVE